MTRPRKRLATPPLQFFTRALHTLAEHPNTLRVMSYGRGEMKQRIPGLRALGLLLASGALAIVSPASHALQPEPQMMADMEGASVGAGPLAAMAGFGHAGPHWAGRRRGPPLLPPFIHLSDAQQDKLFELRHAQAPALRKQFKELRSAHEALRALALTDAYDETRARVVVARAAQADTEIEMLQVRLQHEAYALLTPAQRKRIDECKPDAEGMPPRGCMPPR